MLHFRVVVARIAGGHWKEWVWKAFAVGASRGNAQRLCELLRRSCGWNASSYWETKQQRKSYSLHHHPIHWLLYHYQFFFFFFFFLNAFIAIV